MPPTRDAMQIDRIGLCGDGADRTVGEPARQIPGVLPVRFEPHAQFVTGDDAHRLLQWVAGMDLPGAVPHAPAPSIVRARGPTDDKTDRIRHRSSLPTRSPPASTSPNPPLNTTGKARYRGRQAFASSDVVFPGTKNFLEKGKKMPVQTQTGLDTVSATQYNCGVTG